MPVPKRKRSRARRDSRHANKGLKPKTFAACSNCQECIAPHTACKKCGFYKGRKVVTTKAERVVKRTEVRTKQAEKMQARGKQQEAAPVDVQAE